MPEDFAALEPLLGGKHPYRARTLTATADGKVLGVGGLVYLPDGTTWASVVMSDEARRYPTAIHRAGLAAMKMIRRSGARRVFARAEDGNNTARRWLMRLGFTEVADSDRIFVWRADAALDR